MTIQSGKRDTNRIQRDEKELTIDHNIEELSRSDLARNGQSSRQYSHHSPSTTSAPIVPWESIWHMESDAVIINEFVQLLISLFYPKKDKKWRVKSTLIRCLLIAISVSSCN